jgi:hypothetical protein
VRLGKIFPDEELHQKSRCIVLSGVPSKSKISLFLQVSEHFRLLFMKRLLTP